MTTTSSGTGASGALYALAAFGLFATHDAIIKALGADYAVFQILFFSVLFGMPLAIIMLMGDRAAGTLRPKHPRLVALRTALAVVTSFSAFYAFTVLPLAEVYAIIFAQPLLITALSVPMLGETVGGRRWAAVVVGLIGVLVVLNPGVTEFSLGHLAALVAAVCGSLVSVILRRIGREERSAVLLLYPMVAILVAMGLAMPFNYVPMPMSDLAAMMVVAALGFAGTLGLIRGYRRTTAAVVAPMQYSQMIWAVAFGMLFFAETPARNTLIGSGIIIASGIYIVFRESKGGTSRLTPVLRTRSLRGDSAGTLRTGDIMRLKN